MPLISKFQINRYKQIPIKLTPGTISDGGFSTFELNSKSLERRGTSDFDGVLIRLILLGEIEKNSLNTGNVSIAQFNQLSQQEVDDRVLSGTFFVNKERVGWVELGSSRPSFYYEDCTIGSKYGKRPKSDNYFDLLDMAVSPYLVNGNGFDNGALQRLNNWNVNETIGNWGSAPYPNQMPMGLNEYLNFAILGQPLPAPVGSNRPIFIPRLYSTPLSNIPLLIADYLEHFEAGAYASNNGSTFTLSPSFAEIDSDRPLSDKVVYGRLRNTIQTGFKPIGIVPREFPELNSTNDLVVFENRSNVGDCLALSSGTILQKENGNLQTILFFQNDSTFTVNYTHPKPNLQSSNFFYRKNVNISQAPPTNALFNSVITSLDIIGSSKTFNPAYLYSKPYMLKTGVIYPEGENGTIDPNTPIDPSGMLLERYTNQNDFYDVTLLPDGTQVRNNKKLSKLMSHVVVRKGMFRTKDISPWKQEKSLNIAVGPYENCTFKFYKLPDSPIFDIKRKIANSGTSIDNYRNKLIEVRDKFKKKRDQYSKPKT
jgi:hypothetical protein